MAFRKKRKDPFKEIQACLQKRDYKGALDWFNTLLQKDRKNTQIRLRFADTLVLAGHKAEAVKQYRVVADELAGKGFMIRAIAINKKILQLDPRQTDVHEKLAEMNEGRATTASSRQSLAAALTQPDAPLRRSTEESQEVASTPAPPPSKPPDPVEEAPAEVLPELSLEESMEMEFGAGGTEVTEAPPEPTPPVEETPVVEEPIPAPPPAEEEPVVASGGFELIEDVAPSAPGAEEPPAVLEEAPTFTEEPLELGGPSSAEPEPEVVTIDADASAEEELSLSGIEAPSESPEIVLEVDQVSESPAVVPGEEMEVIELEVESEPTLAPAEAESLIGALGEDIDSLIDSIIDDVGSSAKGEQPTHDEPPTHIPLFSDLNTAEFVDVAILLVRRVAKIGEIIVREGDPGDSMFIISTGEVRATVDRDGQQLPVATLRDGDFFGEMAVLSGEPRTATVTAVKNTELLELSRENLREICSRHPHVEAKIRLAYDERVSSDRSR